MSAAPVAAAKEKPKTIDDAAAQLKRLLITLPMLADDSAHKVADVAESLGVSEETLARDLRTLVTRFDDGPGGFVEGVRLAFGADTVQLESHLFKRPMGLTADEIGALEVGLAALEQELPPHDAAVARQARQRLAEAAADYSQVEGAAEHVASQLVASDREGALLAELRNAITMGVKIRLVYRGKNAPDGEARELNPYRVVFSRGRWFLLGSNATAGELRIFRLDRIAEISLLDESAAIPQDFDLDKALLEGRGIIDTAVEFLTVKYSPSIARWIAEREDAQMLEDGAALIKYPLLDDDWAVRHTLQYAHEAELISPTRTVERLRECLAVMTSR